MKPKEYIDQKLNESSLSRLFKHMQEHDTGTITAYRSEYTHKENQQRNKSLELKLADKRYNITDVKGSYIENFGSDSAKEVGEHVLFVVNTNDVYDLEKDLKTLGEYFDQDSILFIPKGGKEGKLIGTSHRTNAWPKYNQTVTFKSPIFGEKGEFMTKVKNRPFVFKESIELTELKLPTGFFGRYGTHGGAVADWRTLEI